jgi:hypothetical protein
MECLIKEDILAPLYFFDLDHCVDCIKGKYVKHIKKSGATHSSRVLEIIHTSLCGPFNVSSVDGFNSFITFTSDFSRYGYIFPRHELSNVLDKFKIFKVEIENQHDAKIKVVSDRGREYYRKHTPYGQIPSPFAKILEENGIVAQYLLPYEPQQNDVAKRWNCTLMDMVHSMLSNSTLSLGLCMGALKIAAHIINRVSSKSVSKTPYELWTGRNPSINYLLVWDFSTEVKIFNSQLGKLNPKTISCHFIGYPDKSKGYRFYCPEPTTKFVDTRYIVFLECDISSSLREINLEEIRTYVPQMTHVDFIPMTVDAPHVEYAPLTENDNSLVGNLGTEPTINENEGAPLVNEPDGLEENEVPPSNDHEEEPQ